MFNEIELRDLVITGYMKKHNGELNVKLLSDQIMSLGTSTFTLPYKMSFVEGGINKTTEGSFTYRLDEFDVKYYLNKK